MHQNGLWYFGTAPTAGRYSVPLRPGEQCRFESISVHISRSVFQNGRTDDRSKLHNSNGISFAVYRP